MFINNFWFRGRVKKRWQRWNWKFIILLLVNLTATVADNMVVGVNCLQCIILITQHTPPYRAPTPPLHPPVCISNICNGRANLNVPHVHQTETGETLPRVSQDNILQNRYTSMVRRLMVNNHDCQIWKSNRKYLRNDKLKMFILVRHLYVVGSGGRLPVHLLLVSWAGLAGDGRWSESERLTISF